MLKRSRGFSLIELLVVMAIFIVITTVVLFNQSKFSSNVNLTNEAYAVAGHIREAQVYGTLVGGVSASFTAGYGIYFHTVSGVFTYDLFVDNNTNSKYDAGDIILHTYTLANGVTKKSLNTEFSFTDTRQPTDSTVVFFRPFPEAVIKDITDGYSAKNQEITLVLKSALGNKTKQIVVSSVGVISIY